MKQNTSISYKIKHALRLDHALKLVWQAGPGWSILSIILIIIQGVLPVIALYLMKLIIDAVTLSITTPDKSAIFKQVVFYICLGAGIALLQAFCQLMGSLVRETQALYVTDYVTHILHSKSIEMDLEYFENPEYFDTFHRAQQQGPYRPTRIVNGLMQIGQSGISMLAMVGLIFAFHWGAAVVLFLAAIPGVLVRLKYSNVMFQWQQQATKKERKSRYFSWMLTGEAHAKEIRLFDIGDIFIKHFNDLRLQLRQEKLGIFQKRAASDFVAQTGTVLALFGAFGFIVYRAVYGMITIGDMVMYFQAFQRGIGHLKDFLAGLAGIYEDNLFISNFYEFLEIKNNIQSPPHPRSIPKPMKKGITFDHVSFKYPLSERNVIEDISFTIKPDETIALVGENGSGKTTLVKLLCRFYDPVTGKIMLDDVNLNQYDPIELRRVIGVLFQDFAKYHLSAMENIWLGDRKNPLDQEESRKRIKSSAKKAGADTLISGLPNGYDSILGRWLDQGEELSQGEWQKISLARSFMRESQLMILDEPASSLDANSEYEIFKRFKQLTKGRSAVLISHRFSTVQMADRIFVLENGKIIEKGSHKELLDLGGKYAGLFNTQAQYYQ